MSEMIERAARAILAERLRREEDSTKPLGWDDAHDKDRAEATALARAAIEAMREPTVKMGAAGAAARHDALGNPDYTGSYFVWRAMIAAALDGSAR